MPDQPAVMLAASRLIFDSPSLAMLGTGLASCTVIALAWRRMSNRSATFGLLAIGLIVLGNAAGRPRWVGGDAGGVAVMVDLSASARGAPYRDEAALAARVRSLLGNRPHTVIPFGEGDADHTTLPPPPPDAPAVLLFSDGRFDPPATAPPVYAVIDPALEQPVDAAVTSLERRGARVIVGTSNQGGAGIPELVIDGNRAPIPRGVRTFAFPATDTPTTVARLTTGDAWPENDALTLAHPPPALAERWWVGDGAPAGWRPIAASDLPVDATAWLAPYVIVLHNVPANALSAAQAQRLEQYVRDLGGGLLVLGGDQAFAAGGYDGSPLGPLSPLASTPPAPAAHWTFLLDASGSMAAGFDGLTVGEANGRSRLAAAVSGARAAAAQLPPNDLLGVAGFADDLRWWTRGKPVKEFVLTNPPPPPPPRGPTNLDAALRALAASLDRAALNHVVLLTDGQVELPRYAEIAASLKGANARLHVFAIGAGPGLAALRALAQSTGGTYAHELDVGRWASGLVNLLRQLTPRHWITTPVEVRFDDLSTATARAWNRTWLKAGADELARTVGDDPIPMAAQMNVGAAQVAAVAFRPPDDHVEALAKRVQSPPHDPRLKVTWRSGRELTVDVDAADETAALNGLSFTLALSSDGSASRTKQVPQTGPGRYALSLPAPRSPVVATLSASGRVIDRFAVAGRYPPEFDGIGNDRAALASLAERTGGRVIEPHERGPLALRVPARRGMPLAPPLAAAGALLVGLGLLAWRIQR